MSPAEIADALGLPRNNVKQLLFKMAKSGEVVKTRKRAGICTRTTPVIRTPISPPITAITTVTGEGMVNKPASYPVIAVIGYLEGKHSATEPQRKETAIGC
jgi:hypothetical protein